MAVQPKFNMITKPFEEEEPDHGCDTREIFVSIQKFTVPETLEDLEWLPKEFTNIEYTPEIPLDQYENPDFIKKQFEKDDWQCDSTVKEAC